MRDNVIISIKSRQDGENGPDEIELVTAGRLMRTASGALTVTYQETELTGLQGTTTVVRLQGPRVTLLREGTVNSQMIFEEGRRHLSMYETPYGALSIGVDTRTLRSTLEDSGGALEIDYNLDVDNLLVGRTRFRMEVRRDDPIKQ